MSARFRLLWGLAALLYLAAPLRADVPRSLPFQASVKTAAGAPLPDAPVPVVFNFYGEGGALVWSNSQTVTPKGGVISATIPVPDSAALNQPLTVGVKLGSDPEMSPRLPLAAAPYALALPNVAVDRASGAVGIGAAPDPAFGLTVGGLIRSTAGGIRFPDGTTQATAQLVGPKGDTGSDGPQGPTGLIGPRGPAGSVGSGFPASSGLVEPSLQLTVSGIAGASAVRLVQPFRLYVDVMVSNGPQGQAIKVPGKSHFGTLVLQRGVTSGNLAWSDWTTPLRGRYTPRDVVLTLYDISGTAQGTWTLSQCLASDYQFIPQNDSVPIEQITIAPRSAQRSQWTPDPRHGLPPMGDGMQTTVTIPGKEPIRLEGPMRNSSDLAYTTQDPNQPPLPTLSNFTSDNLRVYNPYGVLPDLYPWFSDVLQGRRFTKADAMMNTVNAEGRTLATAAVAQCWPSEYDLIPCDDGGVVEQYTLVNDSITRQQ